ncbi:hypothetical protein EXIGLDRAFT_97348 [Exidia glandulosa HHB12029]|uniref:F-box domain-containing protein n=1 Tax=Exidia glandulosa HHB12029 TaxID=1314781 RepID=A0A166AF48_EXIGL|nr:hypothetical protein EXIGLDRAFT_97348 [Exidia glandulosa HHB12029]
MPALTELPPELFERILVHLRTKDIYACAATCKLLHSAVALSPLLQYHIDLEVAGLQEGPACAPGIQDRVRALHTFQKRWNTLDWHPQIRAPFWDSGNIWDLYGGVFGQGNIGGRGTAFHFTRLPSRACGVETVESWEFKNIEVPNGVRDFSFDPAQDLLVLLDMKSWPLTVHLRTLSTNERHPRATKHAFEYMREGAQHPDVRDESFYLQIMGHLVAVLRLPRGPRRLALHNLNELVILNWVTGELVTTLQTPYLALLTFSFISPTHFIAGVGIDDGDPTRFSLASNPRIQVYRFDPHAKTHTLPTLTATLLLPELQLGYRIGYLLTRSDPAPAAVMSPKRPFGLAPDDRLLVITLMIRKEQTLQVSETVNFFVHMSTLLDLERQERDGTGEVPWDRWSSRARCYPTRPELTWVCYVYGSRFILPLDVESGIDGRVHPCVLDFNQMELRRVLHDQQKQTNAQAKDLTEAVEVINIDADSDMDVASDGDEAPDDEWEDEADTEVATLCDVSYHRSDSFKKPIKSALPFRSLVSKYELRCTALMLDEDNIVCVKEDDPRRLSFLPL